MKEKFLHSKKNICQLSALVLVGIFCFFKPQMLLALDTADVISNVDMISSDVLSIIKANGIKVLTNVIAWCAVPAFAIANRPLGKPAVGALVVTIVTVFIHKMT